MAALPNPKMLDGPNNNIITRLVYIRPGDHPTKDLEINLKSS